MLSTLHSWMHFDAGIENAGAIAGREEGSLSVLLVPHITCPPALLHRHYVIEAVCSVLTATGSPKHQLRLQHNLSWHAKFHFDLLKEDPGGCRSQFLYRLPHHGYGWTQAAREG